MKTQDAIQFFGNKSRLAKALQISKQAVGIWGDTVPLGRAYQIEIITNGHLKAPRPAPDAPDQRAA